MFHLLKLLYNGLLTSERWIVKTILKIGAAAGVLLGIIYWFNLDMKLVRFLRQYLDKHYNTMERDVRL